MTFLKLLFSFVIMLSLLLGCSNDKNNFKLIASEKSLPANFDKIAFERKSPPNFQYLVKKAANQLEYEETWNLYGFKSKMPNLDLNENEVFFIGVHESSSCPYKIKEIKISPDHKTITVPLSEPKGVCNSDATPRTFVIGLDKEISKDIENVVIVQSQSRVETSFPVVN